MSDKLEQIQLLFQKRNARKRGPTSSDQYNDMIDEISHDLTEFNSQWNNRLVPITDSLPDGTVDASVDAFANGLDGGSLYTDQNASSTDNSLYWNSPSSRPNTVLEQFDLFYTTMNEIRDDLENQINNTALTAAQISVIDSSGLYVASEVESALAEAMNKINNLELLSFGGVGEDIIPFADNTFNIGSTARRWKQVYVAPASLHIWANASEADGTARDYKLTVDSTAHGDDNSGAFQLQDGSNVLLRLTPGGGLQIPEINPSPAPDALTGFGTLYVSNVDKKLYLRGSDGVITEVGSGTTEYNELIVGADSNSNEASSNIQFHVDGTEFWRVDDAGVLSARQTTSLLQSSYGDATSPGLSFVNDTDTGILRGAAPVRLGFSVSGTERMSIDDSGKVGIGTTPTNTLTVNGGITRTTTSGTYEAGVMGYTDANWGFLFRPPQAGGTAAYLFESYDGTKLMYLTEGGALGIGTIPSAKLHVLGSGAEGGAGWFVSSDSYNVLKLVGGGGATFFQQNPVSGSAAYYDNQGDSFTYFRVNGAGTTAMTIDYLGRVGIGAAPNAIFNSYSTTEAQGRFNGYATQNGADANAGEINIGYMDSGIGARIQVDGAVTGDLIIENTFDNSAGDIRFRTRTAGTDVEGLTILGDGNIGVNATTPLAKFHVNTATNENLLVRSLGGDLGISATNDANDSYVPLRIDASNTYFPQSSVGIGLSGSLDADLHVQNTTAASIKVQSDTTPWVASIKLQSGAGTGESASITTYGTTGEIRYSAVTNYYPTFYSNNAEAMRIDTSGQVGIGCTPSCQLEINDSGACVVKMHAGAGEDSRLMIGSGGSGNRFSYLDLIGDDTYTNFGLRIIRENTGANANSLIYHRGTGGLYLYTQEAAHIEFFTNNTVRWAIKSTGALEVQGTYQLLADDASSTASAPGYSFTGDITTGIFQVSSGVIGFSSSGTEKVSIGGNEPLKVTATTTEGTQALTIDQNDEDKGFIDYQGTSEAGTTKNITSYTTGNSIQGFVKIEINGTEYWMPYYDAPTS